MHQGLPGNHPRRLALRRSRARRECPNPCRPQPDPSAGQHRSRKTALARLDRNLRHTRDHCAGSSRDRSKPRQRSRRCRPATNPVGIRCQARIAQCKPRDATVRTRGRRQCAAAGSARPGFCKLDRRFAQEFRRARLATARCEQACPGGQFQRRDFAEEHGGVGVIPTNDCACPPVCRIGAR